MLRSAHDPPRSLASKAVQPDEVVSMRYCRGACAQNDDRVRLSIHNIRGRIAVIDDANDAAVSRWTRDESSGSRRLLVWKRESD